METIHDKAESAKDALASAKAFAEKVVPSMDVTAEICAKLESLVDEVHFEGLESVPDAMDHMLSGATVGKVVVKM